MNTPRPTESNRPEPPPRGRGIVVVIVLAIIFFALLALIVLRSGRNAPAPAAVNETLTVVPIRVRIRTEPQANAAVVTTAERGERLILLEDRGAWVRVRNSEGLSGWAERANLERTIEQQRREKKVATIRQLPPLEGVATASTALYAGPGIFYPMVGQLAKGSDVTVYTREHDFYAIAHGSSVAYADIGAVDISAPLAHQFDVSSDGAGSTIIEPTETAPPAVAEQPVEPPPLPVPVPPAPVEREPPTRAPIGGVYASVPPGGTQPEEISRVVPNYPPAARRAGVQGAVVVRGIVRRNGRIDEVEVIKDLPYGLGEEARRAVSRWRFRPATYRGETIDVYYTVTVNFRLQ